MKLICYKQTVDDGFAPNPYYGVLTLATCKPVIRHSKNTKIGDWIAGWTSASTRKYATPVGKENLIYLARITDIIPISQYWYDYPQKRPALANGNNAPEAFGDNIYEPNAAVEEGYISHAIKKHCHESFLEKDTKGLNVLICKEFYYFGAKNALKVPIEVKSDFNVIPRGHKFFEGKERIQRFVDFVKRNKRLTTKYHE